MLTLDPPAGIEYLGSDGISAHCKWAVQRFIQFGDHISSATILSCNGVHGLLLLVGERTPVAIKSGFTSGYGGEGPRTFAEVLTLLDSQEVEIDEVDVTPDVLERLNASALTRADLWRIGASRPIRPQRWHDYCYSFRSDVSQPEAPWQDFPFVLPLAHIDVRIADLARRFPEDPDAALLTAYKRLEDIVRERTLLGEHGVKLFSQAFAADNGPLCWKDVGGAEHQGRVLLFTGTYMAFRNSRAHRVMPEDRSAQLAEFLLVNQLFRLEAEAELRGTVHAGS